MKFNRILAIALISLATLSSCSKDDDNKQQPVQPVNPEQKDHNKEDDRNKHKLPELPYVETIKVQKQGNNTVVTFLNAKSNQNWTYFSLRQGKVLKVEKPQENNDWDIAFQRYYVRTNSGLSGKGQGGAIDTKNTNFEAVTSAKGDFITDSEEFEIMPKMGGVQIPTNKKKIYSKAILWAEYAMPTGGKHIPTYTLSKNVFIVKAADGKLFKLQFTDIYGPKGAEANTQPEGGAGFPSFIYTELK